MSIAPPFATIVERVHRRVLGAFRLVDAVTLLPVTIRAQISVRRAALAGAGAPVEVPLHEQNVHIQQNRSGVHVIVRAPFFDEYSASFDDPPDPAETPPGTRLQLQIGITDAGADYLPAEFEIELPRLLDRASANSVLRAVQVPLFRVPGAPVLGGWAVLRVNVTDAVTGAAEPGVLVRVFRSPRDPAAPPIGLGMTEWRGDLCGEALVAVTDLRRFRPGAGADVFETTQPVHLEATRDTAFTGAPDQLPNIARLLAGSAAGVIRRRSDSPPAPPWIIDPPAPLNLRSGHEITVRFAMP
jgi:hypothetical protein